MSPHPATVALLRWFDCEHLAAPLRVIVAPFRSLADQLVHDFELQGPELTVALRKLLEAKDCAVRAAIERQESEAR